ncbi:MAG: hypothetical protein F6K26_50150 [Moorea sp. SIO2I5]|nr:hypothetical protein [Moorena sp. SIO2I5]
MPQCAQWAHMSRKAEPHFQPFVPRSSELLLNLLSKTNNLAATSKPTGNIKGANAIAFSGSFASSRSVTLGQSPLAWPTANRTRCVA